MRARIDGTGAATEALDELLGAHGWRALRDTLRKWPRGRRCTRIVAKRAIRDEVNARLPEDKRSNFLHTSDNSDEAWEYVRIAFPERVEALRSDFDSRKPGRGS